MARSGLQGPYPLTEKTILNLVVNALDWSSAAVFALGDVKEKKFLIRRVGHADGDLANELKHYLFVNCIFLVQTLVFSFNIFQSHHFGD